MKKFTRNIWRLTIGLGMMIFLMVIGIGHNGIAGTGPEISIYFSPT